VADEILARKEADRHRSRSPSTSSRSSHTSAAASHSPDSGPMSRVRRSPSRSGIHDSQQPSQIGSKRRYHSVSSSASRSVRSGSRSVSPERAHRSKQPQYERNTRRRRSSISPARRGRGMIAEQDRYGSPARTSPSRRRKSSMDKSRIARERASLSPDSRNGPPRRRTSEHRQGELRDITNQQTQYRGRDTQAANGKLQNTRERSLSPYSKRLALTQAIGLGGRK